jgi:hypothetical protein
MELALGDASRQRLRGIVTSFQSISRSEVRFHLDSALATIVLSGSTTLEVGPSESDSSSSFLLETPPLRVHLNVGHTIEVEVANVIQDVSALLEAITFRNVTPAALRRRNRKHGATVASSDHLATAGTAAASTISATSRRPPCRNWARLGACDRANCQFTHHTSNAAASATSASAAADVGAVGLEENSVASSHVGALVEPSLVAVSVSVSDTADCDAHAHGGDEGESHSRRAVIFAAWIVASFGLERLKQGTGVLDIAGGKGALAFALSRYGIAATVIDPRPSDKVNLSRLQKKHYRKNPSAVRHSHIHDVFSRAAVGASERMLELVQGCSLIVGLHPDQATDSIVEVAIEFGKPFAVVPCCVFPKLFPHRRIMCDVVSTGGGDSCETRPVLNRADLCEYLRAQCPETASVVRLRMSGANHVVSSRRAAEGDARIEESPRKCVGAASASSTLVESR